MELRVALGISHGDVLNFNDACYVGGPTRMARTPTYPRAWTRNYLVYDAVTVTLCAELERVREA